MAKKRTKADVIARIDEERSQWNALVAEVGLERMEEPGLMGQWTFKDLAAHLLGWRIRTIARLEATAGHLPPPVDPWPADLQDDDTINDWIYEQHRDRPLIAVLTDVEDSYIALRAAINKLTPDQIFDPTLFPGFGGVALANVEFFEHLHDEHEPSVRAWLRNEHLSEPGNVTRII
jgi:hypothetical protein